MAGAVVGVVVTIAGTPVVSVGAAGAVVRGVVGVSVTVAGAVVVSVVGVGVSVAGAVVVSVVGVGVSVAGAVPVVPLVPVTPDFTGSSVRPSIEGVDNVGTSEAAGAAVVAAGAAGAGVTVAGAEPVVLLMRGVGAVTVPSVVTDGVVVGMLVEGIDKVGTVPSIVDEGA